MIHPVAINMWLGMAIELATLAILMASLTAYQRLHPLAPETSRKLFHIGGGLTTLALPWLFASAWPILLLTAITIPALLVLKYVRALKGNLGAVLYRVDRKSFGEIYFPVSVCLLFVLAHGNALLFIIPILMLTLADPAAAVIGGHYGRLRYTMMKGQKSIEGSVAFFLVAFLCTLLPLHLFTVTNGIETLLIATIVGLLVMIVEAIAWEGLDNLFIPVTGFFLLDTLLHLDVQALLIQLVVSVLLLVTAFCWHGQNLAMREKKPC